MSVLAIDGLSLIRRIYEANKEASPEERPEKSADSAIRSLRRAFEEVAPRHAFCALDSGGSTWRHALYPDYKANRPSRRRAWRSPWPGLPANC